MFPDRSASSCYPKFGSLQACLRACVAAGIVKMGGVPPADWVKLVQQGEGSIGNGMGSTIGSQPSAAVQSGLMPNGTRPANGNGMGQTSIGNGVAGSADLDSGSSSMGNGIGPAGASGYSVEHSESLLEQDDPELRGPSELDPNASNFEFVPNSQQPNQVEGGWQKSLGGGNAWPPSVQTPLNDSSTWGGPSAVQTGQQQFGLGAAGGKFMQSSGMFGAPSQPPQPQWGTHSADGAGEQGHQLWGGQVPQAASSPFTASPALYQNTASSSLPTSQPQYATQQAGLWSAGLGGAPFVAPLNNGWGGSAPSVPSAAPHTPMWGDSTWGLGGASGLPQQPAGTTDSTWGFGGGNALPQQPAGKVNDSSDIWNENLPTEQSNSSSKEVFDQGWNMPQVA